MSRPSRTRGGGAGVHQEHEREEPGGLWVAGHSPVESLGDADRVGGHGSVGDLGARWQRGTRREYQVQDVPDGMECPTPGAHPLLSPQHQYLLARARQIRLPRGPPGTVALCVRPPANQAHALGVTKYICVNRVVRLEIVGGCGRR